MSGRPLRIDRPGRRPVIAADDHRRDAVAAARRRASRSWSAGGSASTQTSPPSQRPGKSVQQIKGLGQHMIGRHRLQRRQVEPGGQPPQASARPAMRRRAPRPASGRGCRTGWCRHAHIIGDLGQRAWARDFSRADPSANRARGRKEIVLLDVHADGLFRLVGRARLQRRAQAGQTGLAHVIHVGQAGHHIGQPRVERGLCVDRVVGARAAVQHDESECRPPPPSARSDAGRADGRAATARSAHRAKAGSAPPPEAKAPAPPRACRHKPDGMTDVAERHQRSLPASPH